MNLTYQHSSWPNSQVLQEDADILRGLKKHSNAHPSAIDEALGTAFRKVSTELDILEQNSAAKIPTDYGALFGAHFEEKISALLLLAKYTVLDLANFHRDIRDIERSHANLAIFAETLFRTQSADGLIYLYSFVQENAKQPSLNPRVWANVGSHCLMLLALMEKQRKRVSEFIAHSPMARNQMEQLISFTRPSIIDDLLKDSSTESATTPFSDPPAYVKLLDRLDPGLPLASALGVCSYISAQSHIAKAFETNDLESAIHWYIEGSIPAAQEVLRQSHALPLRAHRDFCEAILSTIHVHPVRLAAIVRELGERNQAERSEGGIGDTNRVLYALAITRDEEKTGVAQIAVRELGAVKNHDALSILADEAPLLPVAEEVVAVMKEQRRLLMLQQMLKKRPQLITAYKKAQEELQEIEKIMDVVWTCDDEEMVKIYIDRLQVLKAYPELERIHKLVQRKEKLAGTFIPEKR